MGRKGDTRADGLANFREAIALYLENCRNTERDDLLKIRAAVQFSDCFQRFV